MYVRACVEMSAVPKPLLTAQEYLPVLGVLGWPVRRFPDDGQDLAQRREWSTAGAVGSTGRFHERQDRGLDCIGERGPGRDDPAEVVGRRLGA